MEPRSSTDLLEAVAAKLSLLLPEVVFVGGCTTQLLITDPAATPARMSDDVDMIVEASSYAEYSEFSERLQGLGFSEDSSDGAPICRWTLGGMKLDVLPTDAKTLGFSSRWYKEACYPRPDGFTGKPATAGCHSPVLPGNQAGGAQRTGQARLSREPRP